jgi:hypothetical protein
MKPCHSPRINPATCPFGPGVFSASLGPGAQLALKRMRIKTAKPAKNMVLFIFPPILFF